jgi:hypothetical protein
VLWIFRFPLPLRERARERGLDLLMSHKPAMQESRLELSRVFRALADTLTGVRSLLQGGPKTIGIARTARTVVRRMVWVVDNTIKLHGRMNHASGV